LAGNSVVLEHLAQAPAAAYLDPVDDSEFRCSDIILVADNMVGLEFAVGAVPELDPDEVTVFRPSSEARAAA
jgi:hypothetical protein